MTQSSPQGLGTRLGLSSLVFLSSFPSPPWSCCTKTLLSGNTGLSSKSKHFQEKTWKSIFSVSTPLCPLCCHFMWLVIKLPTLLLIQFINELDHYCVYLSKHLLTCPCFLFYLILLFDKIEIFRDVIFPYQAEVQWDMNLSYTLVWKHAPNSPTPLHTQYFHFPRKHFLFKLVWFDMLYLNKKKC